MDRILESSLMVEPDVVRARFDRVVREFGSRLSRLAASYVDEPADRDDLFQDILVAVWRALPTFRGDSSERTFVYRVAMNRARTFRSRRYRRVEIPVPEALHDPLPPPDAAIAELDERDRLVRALPSSLREVALPYLEDLSTVEIAELLGITENNVRVRLARARQQLRTLLHNVP
jgi:RNA polymerase sigma-70 factor (ECF subfamily)